MDKERIKILRDEYWWGGTVADGIYMAYKDQDFEPHHQNDRNTYPKIQ